MAETASAPKQERRVYKPHKAGLPHLPSYFAELWHRRDFAMELARTNLRASNTNTALGQLWLVMNPLLLAGVYFLLVSVLRGGSGGGDVFPKIAAGLFLFFYASGTIQSCATSVTNAGSLILNMNFPKMLLIFSNVYLNFRRFIPTFGVYVVIHIIWQLPWSWYMLLLPVAVLLATLVSIGLGAIMATSQVYFRDTSQFLPYFIRIWLYLSPVLYTAEEFLTGPIGSRVGELIQVNPMFAVLGIWADALHGILSPWHYFAIALVWSFGLTIGGVLFFISREREFAVRL